jgi:hypothetical protein
VVTAVHFPATHAPVITVQCKKRVDQTIKEDRRVTLDTVATKLAIGHNAVQGMIGCLCFGTICSRWVMRLLTEDYKVQQRALTSEMLLRYRVEGDDYMLSILTVDKIWFRHFNPESKQQNIE